MPSATVRSVVRAVGAAFDENGEGSTSIRAHMGPIGDRVASEGDDRASTSVGKRILPVAVVAGGGLRFRRSARYGGQRVSERDALDQFSAWAENALEPNQLEWTILKGHILIEDALKYLLACRLTASPVTYAKKLDIPRFPLLVQLAFASDEESQRGLVQALESLNKARNDVSHWIERPEFTDKVKQFVERAKKSIADSDIPQWNSEDRVSQVNAAQQAVDEVAMAVFSLAALRRKPALGE